MELSLDTIDVGIEVLSQVAIRVGEPDAAAKMARAATALGELVTARQELLTAAPKDERSHVD